jgi:hypothetical protein
MCYENNSEVRDLKTMEKLPNSGIKFYNTTARRRWESGDLPNDMGNKIVRVPPENLYRKTIY